MTTAAWGIAFAAVLLAGFLFRRQTSRLGKAIFGTGYRRLRYLDKYWVIEAAAGGRTVKYRTGTLGFGPGLTYLFVESPVPADVSITSDSESINLPAQVMSEVASLRKADGFKQVDLVRKGSSSDHTIGRVT